MSEADNYPSNKKQLCMTVDVEDWFHILESPAVPTIEHWPALESRIARNLDKLLTLFESFSARCTFFWLGWLAQRHRTLVRKCQRAGHEIASHGHAHVLAHEVGYHGFREDTTRSKAILEDITGEPIRGFRAAGFSATKETTWFFDVVKEAGYQYDASVFPAHRHHGGMPAGLLRPHFIETQNGHLLEIPSSVVEIFSHRFCFFGGGYLRLASRKMIRWGLNRLQAVGQPLVVYVHPREIDPSHPRLPLSLIRRFKCYVRLKSTLSKLEWLCRIYQPCSMLETAENYIRSFYHDARTLPVVRSEGSNSLNRSEHVEKLSMNLDSQESFRERLLQVERAMAGFVGSGIGNYTTFEEPQLQVAHH